MAATAPPPAAVQNSDESHPRLEETPTEAATTNSSHALRLRRPNAHTSRSQVDDVMLEFDQYVTYHEMKKKTIEVLSSQEQKFSQENISSQDKLQTFCQTFLSQQCDRDRMTEGVEIEQVCGLSNYPESEQICNEQQQKSVGGSSAHCSSVMSGILDAEIGGDVMSSLQNDYQLALVLETEKDILSGEKAVEITTANVDSSSDDSGEEDNDGDSKDEEYLFPTPDGMEKSNEPQVGKVFTTLDEAKRFVNMYALIAGFGIKKRKKSQEQEDFLCLQQE